MVKSKYDVPKYNIKVGIVSVSDRVKKHFNKVEVDGFDKAPKHSLGRLLDRHSNADWGEQSFIAIEQNVANLLSGKGTVKSIFDVDGVRIVIATSEGSTFTRVCMIEDY